jgi:hypothetical protein
MLIESEKGKVIREEFFPYLFINGWSETGIIQWVDFGPYFKVQLKPTKT